MEILLPKQIEYCINTIESHGYEAWCVGGAVRDHVMKITPGDYDVTTNALPEDIISMFEKTVPTGIKHGTVTVIIDKTPIEVTTYRSDIGYSDHRKPQEVHFIHTVDGDLSRRDFTMNAICYHSKRGIYDPLCGIEDINNKTIRSVGDPQLRFNEDALRIMRAFRFSCQLNFSIEQNTLNAALDCAQTLKLISAERIFTELKKALLSDFPENLSLLTECGALESFGFPAIAIPASLKNAPKDFSLRVAILGSMFGFDVAACLKMLKIDNMTQKNAALYHRLLNMPCNTAAEIKRMLLIGGFTLTEMLIGYIEPKKLSLLNKILSNKEPYSISMLNINGDDLMDIGITGSDISNTLSFLLDAVIENPDLNNKETLIKLAKNRLLL